MKEFGSDFHYLSHLGKIVDGTEKLTIYTMFNHLQGYASGRHAIEAIAINKGWKRIWIPSYFCYEVIDYLSQEVGISIIQYDDNPLSKKDSEIVKALPYEDGDALLRVNFYGLREFRSNKGIKVPVIEDHTHDMMSEWSLKSDADFCISSIRKSMPTAAGGILWSPKRLQLPKAIEETEECKAMVMIRYEAMRLKHEYLIGHTVNKGIYREKMQESEKIIDKLRLSGMDVESMDILKKMNYGLWSNLKTVNWKIAFKTLSKRFNILKPTGNIANSHPFSIIILCDTPEERIALRQHLIKNRIYPAILWQVPEDLKFPQSIDFSKRMLSVHCDPRYSTSEIKEMCERILEFKHQN